MNHGTSLSTATNERVLWNLRSGVNSVEAVLRRISNRLELRYICNGQVGTKVDYWDEAQLVNDAEDMQAELLAAGWSAARDWTSRTATTPFAPKPTSPARERNPNSKV